MTIPGLWLWIWISEAGGVTALGLCRCKTSGLIRCRLGCPKTHLELPKRLASLEVRMGMLSHFAGDECVTLRGWVTCPRSHSQQMTGSKAPWPSPDPSSASWPSDLCWNHQILWFQLYLDPSSCIQGQGPWAKTKRPSTLSIFCGEQFVLHPSFHYFPLLNLQKPLQKTMVFSLTLGRERDVIMALWLLFFKGSVSEIYTKIFTDEILQCLRFISKQSRPGSGRRHRWEYRANRTGQD